MSLRDFLREVPLLGTIEYEHRVHPFKPSSEFPRFAEDNFLKHKKKQREKLLKQQYFESKKRTQTRVVVDAETGERHTLTKSVWSSEEGQLGNDMKTIMGRGTGHLDIFRKEGDDERQQEETAALHSHVPSEAFVKFMQEGPLNEYNKAGWSPEKKIKERKLAKELAAKSKAPSRQGTGGSRAAASRQRGAATETLRSRGASEDASSVFGTDPSVKGSRDEPPLLTDTTDATEGGGALSIAVSAAPGDAADDATLSPSDGGSSFADGQSISDALKFYSDDGELIEFDFSKVEQQLHSELKRAALYINSKRAEKDRKTRDEIEKSTRDIAHTKAVGYRDVYNAVCDEKMREEKRAADLLVLLEEKDRKPMRAKHAAERRASQNYIKQMQYDNEVLLICKMKAEKYLW